MISVDATPLVVDPRRGVARALRARLAGWAQACPDRPLTLFAPRGLDDDVGFEVVTPNRSTDSSRTFRRRLPALLLGAGATVLYSPFSAFPRTTVPVVVTVHELPWVRGGDAAEGRLRARSHRWWLRRDVTKAAAIVVPSEATRDDLLQVHPYAAARVHVIPNAFDPTPWARAAEGIEKATPPTLVVVGTGHGAAGARKKGLDVFFDALRVLPDVRAVVVGRVRGRVPAGVEVRTDLDDDALARLVAAATCLVHPARSEGFGYPPLEAMAVGTPVVTTTGGALPEIVGDAALVVPCDRDHLAAALREMLADDALRARYVEAGGRRVRDAAFDPQVGARRLAAVLEGAEAER